MNLYQLKKSRNFEIKNSFNDDEVYLSFHHSDINKARQVLTIFKSINASQVGNDVNGGKAVGGYFASGFISRNEAKKLSLL